MSFLNTYRPLFTLELLHHYFLDDGTLPFDQPPVVKEDQLENYNFKDFITILPSEETLRKTLGHKIVLKHTASGLVAFIKAEETIPNSNNYQPYHALSQTNTLTFLLYATDALFGNYSLVTAVPEVPFYFSNKKPGTEPNTFKYIDVSSTTTAVSAYTISATTYQTIAAGLSAAEKIGLLGIVQFEMSGDDTVPIDTHPRNLLNVDGTLPVAGRAYKIQFQNRNTIWNYRDAADSSLLHSSDPQALPLVKNGIVGYSFGGKKRPAATPSQLLFEKDGGGNIIKTISEIYIN